MAKRAAARKPPAYDAGNDIGAVDRVRFCIINNNLDALTADELQQYKRWQQIDDWIRSKRFKNDDGEIELVAGRRAVRNLVMMKYSISWDTAERDIRNAIRLFTPILDEKEYHRSVYIEDLEETAQLAKAAKKFGDYKAIMELAGKWREFDKEEVQESQDKLQAVQFIIQYNPEAIGLKTLPNKDEVFARWQQKKAAREKMAADAEDAIYDI